MKIVINKCYGGFSVSKKAVIRMRELGSEHAKAEVFSGELNQDGEIEKGFFGDNSFHLSYAAIIVDETKNLPQGTYGHVYQPISRANPILVQVVEELGDEASGSCAKLRIIEIPDDIEWYVEDYDGQESIHEKHEMWS
jgi:hypothetical protein